MLYSSDSPAGDPASVAGFVTTFVCLSSPQVPVSRLVLWASTSTSGLTTARRPARILPLPGSRDVGTSTTTLRGMSLDEQRTHRFPLPISPGILVADPLISSLFDFVVPSACPISIFDAFCPNWFSPRANFSPPSHQNPLRCLCISLQVPTRTQVASVLCVLCIMHRPLP